MCVFCAAVPMTVSAGIVANAKQQERLKRRAHQGQKQAARVLRLKPRFAALVAGLVLCAVVYHTTIAPRVGFW